MIYNLLERILIMKKLALFLKLILILTMYSASANNQNIVQFVITPKDLISDMQAHSIAVKIGEKLSEYIYSIEAIDIADLNRSFCGNNGIWENLEKRNVYKNFARSKEILLKEWNIKGNPYQSFFCLDNEGDGFIIMIDRKAKRYFWRSPHNNKEFYPREI